MADNNNNNNSDIFPVTVHRYPGTRKPCAFEHTTTSPTGGTQAQTQTPRNALVFIGGLGDGPPAAVPYARAIAAKLSGSTYSLFEARLSTAFTAFGYGSLAQDVAELAALVAYLRASLEKERVVLLGHSTGCQDCLAYAAASGSDGSGGGVGDVDGFVLQGPVSDREAVAMDVPAADLARSVECAAAMIARGGKDDVMPRDLLPEGFRAAPVTAYRWFSLVGVGGDDDFFSSDLPDDKVAAIWGGLRQPVLIVPSGEDEFVAGHIDVPQLVVKWKKACAPGIASDLSGLIPGANHSVDSPDAQEWLADRVVRFLAALD
ncbi:hypothetical protein B0T26DRAFT_674511 [Lasiosphaeria miniovina]|uniref:Uncharacterized protein n=1 Tax=Lasiosphaeria miniovina TaxID=1954250 RepID=A0AA40AVU1_9PEZI|nr:uncharacterized protein B0T26DRAFT_674511 [Lasiosphaeria miniovina]KAK0722864.1 hypothetical protein B0T26DRAFT_674511 [Lasiosphaeria miniovina]